MNVHCSLPKEMKQFSFPTGHLKYFKIAHEVSPKVPAVGPRTTAAAAFSGCLMYTKKRTVGTWLSLVERTLGVGEVAGSNPVVPTIE